MDVLDWYNRICDDENMTHEDKIVAMIQRKFNTHPYTNNDWHDDIGRRCGDIMILLHDYAFMENYVIVEKIYENFEYKISVYDVNAVDIAGIQYYNISNLAESIRVSQNSGTYIKGTKNAIMNYLMENNRYPTIVDLMRHNTCSDKIEYVIAKKIEFETV